MYIPPDGDKVDFNLEVFTPPSGDNANFELIAEDKFVDVVAHATIAITHKAHASLPFVYKYKIVSVVELKEVSGTWKCPAGIINDKVLVECWGGGGSGKGGYNTYTGGGGGAFASALVDVVVGNHYDYIVAKRTSTPPLYADAIPGEDTYWEDGAEVKAVGGGAGGTESASGGRDFNCVGTIRYSGGASAARSLAYGSGGGGGAGSGGPGKNAIDIDGGVATEEYGGAGGKGAYFPITDAKGGFDYGGGGGGGAGAGPYGSRGGYGASGLIRLTYDQLVAFSPLAHVLLNLGARAQAKIRTPAMSYSFIAPTLRWISTSALPLLYPSTWHPGGETRAPTIVKLPLIVSLPSEFGIGLSMKMPHGSGEKNHVFWQAGEYVCYYDNITKKISMTNGIVTADIMAEWQLGDIVRIYAGVKNCKLFLQVKVAETLGEMVTAECIALKNVDEIYIGCDSDEKNHINAVVADFVYHDHIDDIDAEKYLGGVT